MELKTFTAIPSSVMMDKDLTQTAKLLYGVILGFQLNGRKCIASNKWLGDYVGISSKGVEKALKSLEDNEYITKEMKSKNERVSIVALQKGISGGFLPQSDGVPTPVGHTILDNILDNNNNNIIMKNSSSYGNTSVNELTDVLKKVYPHPLEGITNRNMVHTLIRVISPRKNKDEWMDKDWRVNFTNFYKWYKNSVDDEEYLVRSIRRLKDKAKDWRENGGPTASGAEKKSIFDSHVWQ